MASWKFRCDLPDGFTDFKVRYRGGTILESLGVMAQNDETATYDDAVELDAKCIKCLENHKSLDPATGSYVQTFTKLAV